MKERLINRLVEEFGQNRNQLSIKNNDELQELYNHLTKKRLEHLKKEIEGIIDESKKVEKMSDTEEIKQAEKYWREISDNIKNPKKLYKIIDTMVRTIDIVIINEMVDNHTNEQTYNTIFRKIRVKYRQFQEELLDEIKKLYLTLPEEEMYNQVVKLKNYKEDLNKLKYILETFTNPKKSESIKKLAAIKKEILKNYFPDAHDVEYREYIENKIIKTKLIDKIVAMKNGYTKEDLLSKSVEDLRNLREFLVEEHNKMVRERKLYNKYVKAFEDEFYNKDDTSLSLLAKEARKELELAQMREIVEAIKNFDSAYGEKVNLLLIGAS